MIDLTEQLTQAQIAFALVLIAGSLVYIASKLSKKSTNSSKR